jgi:hypothetical protein
MMMNPHERELVDLLAASTAMIELPHTDCNFAESTAPLSARRENRSNLPLPLTNTERDTAPRLNVFDQALVPGAAAQ